MSKAERSGAFGSGSVDSASPAISTWSACRTALALWSSGFIFRATAATGDVPINRAARDCHGDEQPLELGKVLRRQIKEGFDQRERGRRECTSCPRRLSVLHGCALA